jgi:hypothetical protein
MNKQFGMTKNIIMLNINNQRKNIGKSTSQGKRLKEIIGIMFKGRPTWLRNNIKSFPQKQLEKEPLVQKDVVKNSCDLKNIKKLPKMMMNLKLEVKLRLLLKICL